MSMSFNNPLTMNLSLLADVAVNKADEEEEEERRRLHAEKLVSKESVRRKRLSLLLNKALYEALNKADDEEEEELRRSHAETKPPQNPRSEADEEEEDEEEEEERRRLHAEKLVPRESVRRKRTSNRPTMDLSLVVDVAMNMADEELRRLHAETNTPQNPRSEPVLCDEEEQRRRKGKAKVVYEDDHYEANKKKRFGVSLDHLKDASTTSSFLNLRCSEPPNPNYQSSSSSSSSRLPTENTNTPEWVFKAMQNMNADAAEPPRLIFERELSDSDVAILQSRLLMPFKKLISNDFLTHAEFLAMDKGEDHNKEDDKKIGVETTLVTHRYENNEIKYDMWPLRFRIWGMGKKKKDTAGNGTLNYVLNRGWNAVVDGNGLQAKDKISIWIFRCCGKICFALEKVRKSESSSS